VRERAARYAALHLRWNVTFLELEAIIFLGGMAFFDFNTVLPVLLHRLGASDFLIGFTRFLSVMGYAFPALFAAHLIHGRIRHKWVMLTMCGISRTALLAIPISLLLWGGTHPFSVAFVCVSSLGVFWLFDGASAISWMDILGKAIHERIRGRFFGIMQTLGGMAAMGAGIATAAILSRRFLVFPYNFALLAGVWCVAAGVAQVMLSMIREPEGVIDPVEAKPSSKDYLRRVFPLLRDHPSIGKIIGAKLLMDGAGMALPFYILFARQRFHISLAMVGIYLFVQNIGRLSTGPLWGWLSDRYGAYVGLRWVAGAIFCAPLFALLSWRLGGWMIPVVFYLVGAVQDGCWMTTTNAVLCAAGEHDRPFTLAVSSLFQMPSALWGPLGGLLLQEFSYGPVFTAALICGAGGLLLTMRLVLNGMPKDGSSIAPS